MSRKIACQLPLSVALATVFCVGAAQGLAQPAATTTTLAVTSADGAATTIESGNAITLTAAVSAGAAAVTTGQVKFCDAAAAFCTDIHILGAGQLTSAGTATLKLIPGIGSHSYKAIFVGTTSYSASTSGIAPLTVTGLYPTTTTIAQVDSVGSYSLSATVVGTGGSISPTGTVSFVDTSNGNAALGTAELGAGAPGLSFLNSSTPATGPNPASIAVGDFNKDGIPDLAVANSGSGTVTILLGKGDGTFTQAPNSPIAAGTYPWSLASGDFNGDGTPDLAVVNYGDNTVSILLGNGDGTFTTGSLVAVGTSPTSAAVGDFNGDGIADLAIVNSTDSTVTILLGNGNGTFTQAPGSPAPVAYAYSLAVGDFNGDGIQDLAVLSSGWGYIAILLGNGDGSFTTSGRWWVSAAPSYVAVGDFNGDGVSDLAAVNYGNNTVTILLGNGDGTFAWRGTFAVGAEPISMAIGDFNGDGIPDLAVVNAGSNTVSILLGKGDGTFAEAANSPVAAGTEPVSIAAEDFNGDGISDLAVANLGDSTISTLLPQLTQTTQATIDNISSAGIATHLVQANYPGDASYSFSKSGTIALSGGPLSPTVQVSLLASSITTAQDLVVTVAVNGVSGAPTPTGTVTVTGGGYSSMANSLSGGTVTIDIPAGSLALGSDTLTASYAPDSSSSQTYSSSTGSVSVVVTLPLPATPTVTVTPSSSNIATTQGLTVTVAVSGGGGNPSPTGLVTLKSSNPDPGGAPLVYDTFQYPDGTLINGVTAQSGNSVWMTQSSGIGALAGNHLVNIAPSGELGDMYAILANTSTIGGTPSQVTTLGGTIRMCPSSSGTYDPSYTSVGLIASDQTSLANHLELGFGPTSWWVLKVVNGTVSYPISGPENIAVDCKTDYTVEMIIDPVAGTLQVIPPNGVPSAVIADPDMTTIGARYGIWEPENNAPNKYIGEWGSVWMGGGYTSPSAKLNAGTATITIPAGSLALGSGTLTASYTPDASSSTAYTSATGVSSSVTVAKATPSVAVTPSSSSITTTQGLTVTVAVSGDSGATTPTGSVTITSGSYTSTAATLSAGSATINIPAGSLALGSGNLTATYSPDRIWFADLQRCCGHFFQYYCGQELRPL